MPRKNISSSFRFRYWLIIIALTAFAVRSVHVISLLSSSIGETVVLDARYYFTEAGRLLGYFGTTETGINFMNLGYPYIIAALCAFFGYHVSVMLWLQAVVGAACAALIASIVYTAFSNKRAAILAGFLYAFYAQAIFYDGLVLTPSVINLSVCGALFAAVRGLKYEKPVWLFAAGIGVGVAALLRANSVLLAVVWTAIFFAWAVQKKNVTRRFMYGIFFVVGSLLIVLPPMMYNGVRYGEWVMVSANSGMNFWVGNNANATGIYYGPSFVGSQSGESEQHAFLTEARKRTKDSSLNLSRSSTFWWNEAFKDIRANPTSWLTLLGKKFLYTWNRYEVQTNVAFFFMKDFSPVLKYASYGFAVIALLGVAGIVFSLRRYADIVWWLMITTAAVYVITSVFFFVSGEYRHPVSIILCIGSALFVTNVFELIKSLVKKIERAAWEPFVMPAVIAVVIAPMVLWNHEELSRISDPFYSYTNYAQAQFRQIEQGHTPPKEHFDRAVQLLERAPEHPERRLILLEVLCRTHFFAAVSYTDKTEAIKTIHVAAEIFRQDGEELTQVYDRQFLVFLYTNIPSIVREIVKHESFKDDAQIMMQASEAHRIFMNNTTIHQYIIPRR